MLIYRYLSKTAERKSVKSTFRTTLRKKNIIVDFRCNISIIKYHLADGTVELNCQRKHFELYYEPYISVSSDFVRISRGYAQSPTDSRTGPDRQICRSEFRRHTAARLVLRAMYQRCSGIVSLDVRDGTLHTISVFLFSFFNISRFESRSRIHMNVPQ